MKRLGNKDLVRTLEVVINNTLYNGLTQVPIIYGAHGIGKTEILSGLADTLNKKSKLKFKLVELEASQLGEAEIGGMPVTLSGTVDYLIKNPITNTEKKMEEVARVKYAVHPVINECIKCLTEGIIPILFIDEINRASQAVQNELMNFILKKRVVETVFDKEIIMVCAANPSDVESNYNTVEFDPAQKDRFIEFKLQPNLDEWLPWAMGMENGEQRVNDNIIDYLIENNTAFWKEPSLDGTRTPTPRSWTGLSRAMKGLNHKKDSDMEIITALAYGLMGENIGASFVSFLNTENERLDSAEYYLEENDKEKLNEILEKYSNASPSKQYAYGIRLMNYLSKMNDHSESYLRKFSDYMKVIAKDTFVSVSQEMIDRRNTEKGVENFYENLTNLKDKNGLTDPNGVVATFMKMRQAVESM